MFSDFTKYLVVFTTGLVVTLILTPLVRAVAIRFGVVDLPNARRPHKRPTARGGGAAVVLGVNAACLVALMFPWPELAGGMSLAWWKHWLLPSSILVLIGLVDDVRGLTPKLKLAGQVVVALLVWMSGTRFGSIFGFQLPLWLDCLFVICWLIGTINAFNLIDGLDGLASGLAIISAVGLCGIFVIQKVPGNVLVLLGLIGACLGFLRYNFHPATVFLGDTGSMFLGFILGVVSLQTFTKNTLILSFTIPMLVLGVPIYDALLAIWRRSVRMWLTNHSGEPNQKPRGIMQPDLEHMHHRLLQAGLTTSRVATALCAANALLVTAGLLVMTFKSQAAGIFLLALLAGAYVLLRHLAAIELRDTGRVLLAGLRHPTYATARALLFPFWDLVCMSGALAAAMWLFEGSTFLFLRSWFLDLPVWVTPTFSVLAISRVYITVWARARVLDAILLGFTLGLGLLLSLSVALIIDPAHTHESIVRAVVMLGLAHPLMLGLRLVYRFAEELVPYFRSRSEKRTDSERIVLYGAGGRCLLFLKERGFDTHQSFDSRTIIGLIDDDSSLLGQWVCGHPVLGDLKGLPRLIAKHHIAGIVITAGLKRESLAAVQVIAAEHKLSLSEWRFEERTLGPEALQHAGISKAGSGAVSRDGPVLMPLRPGLPATS